MEDDTSHVFLVHSRSDPVAIQIRGRASMYNVHLLKRFLDRAIEDGQRRFAFDFSKCEGLDSTFLGTVKGVAQRLRHAKPAGSIVFCSLGGRNLENVRNVGLDCMALLDCDLANARDDGTSETLEGPPVTREEFRDLVTQAHRVLAEDPRVRGQFEDVNAFLGNDPGPK